MVSFAVAADAQPQTAWWVPWFFALCVLVGVAYYAFLCWRFPYGRCRKCKGAGRFMQGGKPNPEHPMREFWRNCRRCGGVGRRVRLGRRVLEKLVTREEPLK